MLDIDEKQDLQQVDDYNIFYDKPTNKIMNEMQQLDLVIIEPHYYKKEDIEFIKSKGTLVFGYLNIMERDNWNVSINDYLNREDFFYRDGEKIYFEKWDSYLLDITSNHYQSLLLTELSTEITNKGFDGVFLDTIGDIDDQHFSDKETLTDQQEGVTTFLNKISKNYPSLLLIQNWGFRTLKDFTNPYVDGVLWENFDYKLIKDDAWSLNWIEELSRLSSKQNLAIFTVSFHSKRKSQDYAEKLDFTHLHKNNGDESDGYNHW